MFNKIMMGAGGSGANGFVNSIVLTGFANTATPSVDISSISPTSGNLLIISFCGENPNGTAPQVSTAGWTTKSDTGVNDSSDFSRVISYKISDGTESTISFSNFNTSVLNYVCTVMQFRGYTMSAIAASETVAANTFLPPTGASVTPTVAESFVVLDWTGTLPATSSFSGATSTINQALVNDFESAVGSGQSNGNYNIYNAVQVKSGWTSGAVTVSGAFTVTGDSNSSVYCSGSTMYVLEPN